MITGGNGAMSTAVNKINQGYTLALMSSCDDTVYVHISHLSSSSRRAE